MSEKKERFYPSMQRYIFLSNVQSLPFLFLYFLTLSYQQQAVFTTKPCFEVTNAPDYRTGFFPKKRSKKNVLFMRHPSVTKIGQFLKPKF